MWQHVGVVRRPLRRGSFSIPTNTAMPMGHPADTFLSTRGGWSKARAYAPSFACTAPAAPMCRAEVPSRPPVPVVQSASAASNTLRFALQGVAWVNGFNLGWYWPDKGPQMTLFIPGPLLQPGANELLLLEMHRIPNVPAGAGSRMPVSGYAEPETRVSAALRNVQSAQK